MSLCLLSDSSQLTTRAVPWVQRDGRYLDAVSPSGSRAALPASGPPNAEARLTDRRGRRAGPGGCPEESQVLFLVETLPDCVVKDEPGPAEVVHDITLGTRPGVQLGRRDLHLKFEFHDVG